MKNVILCLAVLSVAPAFATITNVQSNAKWTCTGTGTPITCTVTLTTQPTSNNNLLAVWVFWQSSSTYTAGVADSAVPLNTFNSAVGPTLQSASTTPISSQIFYAKKITGSGIGTNDIVTVTFTCVGTTMACMSASITSGGIVAVEYSGLDTQYPLDSVSAGYSTAGNETVLYSFTGFSDGDGPSSVLAMDRAGNLYGTTKAGGNSGCTGGAGCGVAFELSPGEGGAWTEKVLYVFCSQSDCADGEQPEAGPLILDAAGNLYGTTIFGGDAVQDGVVFKLDASGKETGLHSFTGGPDGAFPWSGLTMDSAGNL